MSLVRFTFLAALAAACSATDRTGGEGNDDPGVDAGATGVDGAVTTGTDAATSNNPDAPPAPPLTPSVFPIQGASPASQVIADVLLSCHAMYNPRILRVRVITTDPQGTQDRGSSSGTLKLPDGTNVALDMPAPYSSSPYEERVMFGTGENLTYAQFDQACAAQYLQLSLTVSDETGHVTVAPSLVIAPTVGGAF